LKAPPSAAANAAEADVLEGVASERGANSRLSRQIVISDALDGIVLTLPERQA
jgi:2Fe-2S ferredoxin